MDRVIYVEHKNDTSDINIQKDRKTERHFWHYRKTDR